METVGNPNSAFSTAVPLVIPTVDGVYEEPYLPVGVTVNHLSL